MCSPEWVLKKPPALWMASWNVKAIIVSHVCHIKEAYLQLPKCRVRTFQRFAFSQSILSMGGMMRPQYVELEWDFTLLLWLGISMNDNLSQKQGVHCWLSCLSILSERTVWFLTVTKALIGDQCEYSLSAGLWLVKFQFHGLLHYVDQIKKFGSPLRYYFGGFLESFLKDKLKKPSKRINGHLHRVQHDILILIRSHESRQFGLVLLDRYCSLWSMPQYSVEQTCCLWMSSRSMEKATATQKWCCHLIIYAVPMMTVRLWLRITVIIQLGNIQQGAQKVGKATVFFRFPSKANFIVCRA